jgi:pimeloyl-ACP methyl ester carboxylesterase
LFWFFIVVPAIYVSALTFCFLFQRRFIYQRPISDYPTPISLRSVDGDFVTIRTEDGENIVAWYKAPLDNRPIVIFFHGSLDSPTQRATRFLALASEGFGVLAPYFRGFGKSTGSPTEEGLLLDAAAVYSYCTSLYPAERIALWGFSLGSAVAVLLAARAKVGALILEAPITSLTAIARHWLPFFPVGLMLRDRYCADAAIISVTAPILMLHGEADRESPIALGKLLFEAAPEPKEFVHFASGGHGDLDRYGALAVVRRFLASLPSHCTVYPPQANRELT